MSSYYPSFKYMGLNSFKDKNLIVTHFDVDQGEHDTFLGMDPIYTDSAHGTKRIDYGAKFNNVAVVKITVMKANRRDFTVADVRDFLKWTTGVRQISYLDFLVEDTVKCSFLGRVTSAYQQKLDARTIGLSIEFTSVSPWAYSGEQIIQCAFGQDLSADSDGILSKGHGDALLGVNTSGVLYNGINGEAGLFQVTTDGVVYIDNSVKLKIDNQSDDLYSYIYLDTKFTNQNSDEIFIKNITTGEETILTGLSNNEIVTLKSEQFIVSNIPNKTFGTNFNFVWPRLSPGVNEIVIGGSGIGTVQFEYRYPIKIGDCAIDIYVPGDDCFGCDNEKYGLVSWSDITDTPNTIAGYGIQNAYTTTEVDNIVQNIEAAENIDQNELDKMLKETLGL